MMIVTLDGEEIFSLGPGERGTTLLKPGRYTLAAEVRDGLFATVREQTCVNVAKDSHTQLEAALVPGFWRCKIVFTPVRFEGKYDYS